MAFREHQEECQIIIKSDALRDCVQGEHVASVKCIFECVCSLPNVERHIFISYTTELTDALWAGSVQIQVGNKPMFMKVRGT